MTDAPASQQTTEPLSPAAVRTDGTGWSRVNASPEWWRWAASSPEWPEVAEQIARAGEKDTNLYLCRVVGETTKRPCKVSTRHEPCPHHGEGNGANRCGARTRKGAVCRWNLVVNGQCPNHPQTWERIEQARRAEEEARRRAQEEAAHAAEARRRQVEAAALAVACPYCPAGPDDPCQGPDGAEKNAVHTTRRRFGEHAQVAANVSCSSCGADAGDLCQTSNGRNALDAHAARQRGQD